MSKDLELQPQELPDPDHDKLVLDTFGEYRDEMTAEALERLHGQVENAIHTAKSATQG